MQELKFPFANGYDIFLTRYENGETTIELVNQNDFIIADIKLNESDIANIQMLLSK